MIAVTMSTKKAVWFIVLSISTVNSGYLDLTCNTTRPFRGTNVTCKCVAPNNIEWKLNDIAFSTCTTAGICSPTPPGYGFKIDTSNNSTEYSLDVHKFDYSSCGVYSCTDLTLAVEEDVTLSIAMFDSLSPSVIDEPGNHKNGSIEITTECLFTETEIKVEWYSMKENSTDQYIPDESYIKSTDCTDICNYEPAVRLKIGFNHSEDESSSKQSVKFRLKVFHKNGISNVLDLKTQNEYYIKTKNENDHKTTNRNYIEAKEESPIVGSFSWWKILIILILSIFLCLFLIGIFLGCFIFKKQRCSDRLYIGKFKDDFINNSNLKCTPSCYQILWKSGLGIPIAFGVFLVWKCNTQRKTPDSIATGRDVHLHERRAIPDIHVHSSHTYNPALKATPTKRNNTLESLPKPPEEKREKSSKLERKESAGKEGKVSANEKSKRKRKKRKKKVDKIDN